MNLWQNYICPKNLSEALSALRNAPGPLAPIAGGTDLLLDLGQGRHSPVSTLIDLTSVSEMTALGPRGGRLFIGAAVSLATISRDIAVARHAQALVEACDLIAGPQVRNVATLGGNVAHALPAADGTIALMALGATVEIASEAGTRIIPIGELFRGAGESALNASQELIVGFHVPLRGERDASAFKRVMRPQGTALPILNAAVWIRRNADIVGDVRIAVGPSGPIPRREAEAERSVVNRVFTRELSEEAVEVLLAHSAFRTSARRGSAEYRRLLADTLLSEVLSTAWGRTYR
ncbi:MAG TPA: FAD binding domain-containing protein [Anaerolineales bacterium]